MASVWGELKRRNVVRVAIAYVIIAWLILQVGDTLAPALHLGEWVNTALAFFLILGFPMALFFAWAFEMTPEGLKREHEVNRTQSITSQTGRRLDFLIIGVLVVAVGMLLVDKFLLSESPMTPETVAEDVGDLEETAPSIAVLPFANMSADENSAYFSDGLADTVLHMLAQIRELRVAARTSSFQFRDQSLDVAKIGEQLNVGTILEGSVQRSGDKIRVTAQLIDVSNGYHLWSGNFDRNLDDVFAIQDEIATAVVSALKVSLLGESAELLTRDQTDNVDAYTEYLLGIDDLNVGTGEFAANAIRHLQEAVRLDPDFALAHATLGRAYIRSTDSGFMSSIEGIAAARVAANHALDISARSSTALAVLGLAELSDGNPDAAGQILRKAVEYGPNDTFALNGYAMYLRFDDRIAESVVTVRKVLRLDPFSESALSELASLLRVQRQFSKAAEIVTRWKSIRPMSLRALWAEFWNEYEQSNLAAAAASMTDSYLLSGNDPEDPFMIGIIYLEMDMPTDASQWFDRAVEIDAQHPVSLAAPIVLNYYLQQNEEENVRLARELLTDRIDDRMGSRQFALRVLHEHAAKSGRYDFLLEALNNLYPHLFDDPPRNLDGNHVATYWAGIALIQSGDVERGLHLIQFISDFRDSNEEIYGGNLLQVGMRLILDDSDGALDKLEAHGRRKHSGWLDKLNLERNSLYDPLRDEPAFTTLLDEYRENAAKQRRLIQSMNEVTTGQ